MPVRKLLLLDEDCLFPLIQIKRGETMLVEDSELEPAEEGKVRVKFTTLVGRLIEQ